MWKVHFWTFFCFPRLLEICHKDWGRSQAGSSEQHWKELETITGLLIGSINLQTARYLGTLLSSFNCDFNDRFCASMDWNTNDQSKHWDLWNAHDACCFSFISEAHFDSAKSFHEMNFFLQDFRWRFAWTFFASQFSTQKMFVDEFSMQKQSIDCTMKSKRRMFERETWPTSRATRRASVKNIIYAIYFLMPLASSPLIASAIEERSHFNFERYFFFLFFCLLAACMRLTCVFGSDHEELFVEWKRLAIWREVETTKHSNVKSELTPTDRKKSLTSSLPNPEFTTEKKAFQLCNLQLRKWIKIDTYDWRISLWVVSQRLLKSISLQVVSISSDPWLNFLFLFHFMFTAFVINTMFPAFYDIWLVYLQEGRSWRYKSGTKRRQHSSFTLAPRTKTIRENRDVRFNLMLESKRLWKRTWNERCIKVRR